MQKQFVFLLLSVLWAAEAFPDCTQSYFKLTTNQMQTVNSTNYPNGFPAPSSCQFTVAAPIYHVIEASCNFYVGDRSTYCDPNDALYVQIDGTTNLQNSNVAKYCGSSQQILVTSSFNSITVGYKASRFSGLYQCKFTAKKTNRCDCGAQTTSKIVGGQRAQPNQFPYMAVFLKNQAQLSIKGGGTIISTNAFLTAAHLFIENYRWVQPNDMIVSVARDDLTKNVNSDTPYSASYEIDRIIPHPQYDNEYGINDIAVVITKKNINMNRGVGPCCMPGLQEPVNQYDWQKIIEMGFGTTDDGADYSKALKWAGAYVMSNDQCKMTYGNQLTNNDMCTYSNDRNDTCQGDSGGPIILPSYRDFIVGIVKDGIFCGDKTPARCQRVSPYRPWIEQVVGKDNFFCYFK